MIVLAIGATGSIGRYVVEAALAAGHTVRALVRDSSRADFPAAVEVVVGDLTKPETLGAAVAGVGAVVFTHGSDGGGKVGSRTVDYGAVRNVLAARRALPEPVQSIPEPVEGFRIALMTAIGVTNRGGVYNETTESHDWKRRAERLVRASGNEYTIVRPGWFDYHEADQLQIVFQQGDSGGVTSSTPKDGVISRRQIAQVLVDSLTSEGARHKTLELVAEAGPAQTDLEPLFAALVADPAGSLDAVADVDNQPLADEPADVLADLEAVRAG